MRDMRRKRKILFGLIPVQVKTEQPVYRKRTSKNYEIRVGWFNGDNQDLIDMIDINDFKNQSLNNLLEYLDEGQKLRLEVSERFYERYSSDEQWEFEDDNLYDFYKEGEGYKDLTEWLPKGVVKKLDSWWKKQQEVA